MRPASRPSGPAPAVGPRGRPWPVITLVALLGVLATGTLYVRARRGTTQAAHDEFSRIAADAALRLVGRVRSFEEALHASAGFVMGSDSVTPAEWGRFEQTLRVTTFLSGVTSMAYARRVPGSRVDAPAFVVVDSERLGFEAEETSPFERPGADAAVLQACVTGDVASILWIEGAEQRLHVALIRAVYRQQQRYNEHGCERNLAGMVFIQVHPDLLAQTLTADNGHHARFTLLPGDPVVRDASHDTHQVRYLPVVFGGRRWYLQGTSTPRFENSHTRQFPGYVLLGGLLVTGLAATLAGSEVERRRLEKESRRAMERTLARAETALEQSEQRLTALVDSAMDAILSLGEDGRVVLANPAAAQMMRCRQEDLLGQPLDRFLPERMLERYRMTMEEFIQGARHKVVGRDEELIGRRFDGEEFPVEATLSRAEFAGRHSYILIVRDLSERRAIEAERRMLEGQLRQSQKMEAIGTLAGGIAHDFNNLLGSILGNAEMAFEELDGGHPAREFVGEIVRAGERARDLVRRILGFTRQQEQERKPVHLDATAREVAQLLRATLPARIGLVTEVAPGLPTVLADPGQIHQVLVNLITNSAYAIGERPGTIRVTLRRFAAGTDPHLPESLTRRDCLELAVTDDGAGMDPAVLERIFDPFFTTKPVGQGTGLGLSVAHGIVQQHEGVIRATSARGRGTTVQVLLPALDEEPPASTAIAAPLPHGDGQCVLLVDDEEALRVMGAKILRRLQYTPVVVTGAAEALRLLEAGQPVDILVTDYSMPGLSGIDLAQRAIKLRPDLPIVLLTGYGLITSPDQLRGDGIRAVLPKPVALRALAETLASVNGFHAAHSRS
ncbi:MAG TPA: ATP-binding protein [Gemmatimonadales bacterium]|nr:ATP-binding protein [Gemmatimonadales bacterium]